MTNIGFRIKQDGQIVAKVSGPAIEAEAEIMHYAKQYRCDGDLTIEHNAAGHWKRFILMVKWPLGEAGNV